MNDRSRQYHSPSHRWLATAVAMALFAIVPTSGVWAAPTHAHLAAAQSVGSVIDVQRRLSLADPGANFVPLRSIQPTRRLYNGSRIDVPSGETAAVQFCSNAGHKIRGHTRATLQASSGSSCRLALRHLLSVSNGSARQPTPPQTGVMTSLEIGELYSMFPAGATDGVQTKAATATAMLPPTDVGVAAGPVTALPTAGDQALQDTIVDVRVNKNQKSLFTVVQGQVAVSADSGSVVLGPGDQASLKPGDKPKKTGHVDSGTVANMTSWADKLAGPVSLTGYWVNVDATPSGIADLILQSVVGRETVHAFGACTPTPCDWGTADATTYGADVDAAQGIAFSATYDFSFKQTILTGRLSGDTLVVTSYSRFTDGSGRSDYLQTERFRRLGAPGSGGTTPDRRLSLKAAARQQSPITGELEGDWENVDAGTKGMVKISLQSSGGKLSVHALGACTPTPCDWGSAGGTAYAADVSSTDAVAFAVQFDFGFAETLVTGSLDGGSLQTTSYTRFKDGSDRSNYVETDTFRVAPPPCGRQPGQQCAAIWTDKAQYHIGDTAQVCYSVPEPVHVRIVDLLADGSSRVLLDGNDDGTGDCRTALVTPPAGQEHLRLDLTSLADGSPIASVDTTFEVL